MRLKEEILIDAKQLVDRCKEFQVIGSNVIGAATSVRELEYFEITLGSLINEAEVILTELGEIKPHCGWWYKKVVHSWIVSILQQMEIIINLRTSILFSIGMLSERN